MAMNTRSIGLHSQQKRHFPFAVNPIMAMDMRYAPTRSRPPALNASFALGLGLLISGCAAPMTDYPSLQRRPVETQTGAPQTQAPTTVQNDAALANTLAAIEKQAQDTHETFLTEWPAVQQAVASARNSGFASEAWSTAQTRLSGLEGSTRSLSTLLADLDRQYADRLEQEVSGALPPGGAAQIQASRAILVGLIDAEVQQADTLEAQLAQPD